MVKDSTFLELINVISQNTEEIIRLQELLQPKISEIELEKAQAQDILDNNANLQKFLRELANQL